MYIFQTLTNHQKKLFSATIISPTFSHFLDTLKSEIFIFSNKKSLAINYAKDLFIVDYLIAH